MDRHKIAITEVIDRVPVLVSYVDSELRYRAANETYRAWFGWDPKEMIGKSLLELIGPKAAENAIPYFQRALSGETVEYTAEMPYSTGARYIKANYIPDFDENGKVRGFHALVTDVTPQVKAQLAQQESEDRFQKIFYLANVGIGQNDVASGLFLQANEKFQEIVGYSLDELRNMTAFDLTHPDDRQKDREVYESFVKGEIQVYQSVKKYVRKNGAVIWARVQATAMERDRSGRVLKTIGTAQDITRERPALSNLQQSQAYFQELVDTSPAMIWITDINSDCVYLSQLWYDYTGRTPAQDLGKGWIENIHPDDVQLTSDTYLNAVQSRGTLSVDYRLRDRNGNYRWFVDIGFPRIAKDGTFLGYIGTVTDIHDRIVAVSELKDATERFLRSAKASDLGVWYCDLPFDVLEWNDEVKNHFFLPKDALVTIHTFYERIHPDDRERTRAAISHSIASHAPYDITYRTTNPIDESQVKWIRAIGWTDYDREGNPIRFDGITLDATEDFARNQEFVKAKEEAERANQLKSAFLANMSHEIRTPLGAMIGFSELLRDDGISEEERKNYLNILQRNGEQLSHIINDILDLSKVEAGHLTFEYICCDPKKVASDTISLLSVKAKEKAIHLKLIVDESVPSEVVTDPTRLQQILLNLVGNAVKFTQKGSVTLHVFGSHSDQGKEFVSFEIADTGIGIAASQTSRIFDLFVQADGSTTRKFGGTGLGLTLSRSLARSLGGDLRLVRSEEGKGSVFQATIENRVDMRVRSESRPSELSNSLPTLPEKALNGLNILVVDDSPDNQQLLLRSLAKQGAIVELASDGCEALEKATFGNHDIVLMDIQMPVMDGYTATQKLRDRGYSKPIVALTAHAMTEVRRKSLNVGCNAHLSKPINSKDLIRTIVQLT